MATADVDLVIASERVGEAVQALEKAGFRSERLEGSINLEGHSAVSVQISTETIYHPFPDRAIPADVHGILMRVACLEDTLQEKLLAWRDSRRRPSKRQKDLLDIMRLVEAHPDLKRDLPADVVERIRQGEA